MKERLERNRARLTEAEERKVWQAIADENSKGPRAAWARFRVPAFAGAAAVAVLLVVAFLGKSGGDRSAIDEMVTPRSHQLQDVVEREAAAPETATTRGEIEERATGEEEAPAETAAPAGEKTEVTPTPKKAMATKAEGTQSASVVQPELKKEEVRPAPKERGRSDLVKESEAEAVKATEAAEAPREEDARPKPVMMKKKPGTAGLTSAEGAEETAPTAPGMEKKGAEEPRLSTEAAEPSEVIAGLDTAAARPVEVSSSVSAPVVDSTAEPGATTGTLDGRVVDANTKKEIAWADIVIQGTKYGGISQQNGTFSIHIPAGSYTVIVQMMGYTTKTFEAVTIEAGKVTRLIVELEETATKIEAISVGAAQEPAKIHTSETHAEVKAREDRNSIRGLGYLHDGTTSAPGSREKKGEAWGGVNQLFTGPRDESGGPISVGGTDAANGRAFDAMFFEHYGVNPFIDPEEDGLATFAVDVDRASYTLTRSYLMRGALPPKEAVRVEEFVNAFRHDYAPPKKGAFAIHLDAAPSPFGEGYLLLRVGLKGREIDAKDRKPAVLTFVIDVSGSMNREDRLERVKWSLLYLLDQMNDDDRIGIVVYGSRASVVLEPTAASDRYAIEKAIAGLHPGGSTNAEEGLRMGYEMAGRAFRRGAINRVILCSDGVANVGRTGPGAILDEIEHEASRGIEITAVGFGMGNYNDVLLEQLADKGDGNYYYVDTMDEAKRVFVENLTGTLQTIAKEVKVQVVFEPGTVRRYRLLGYENRDVKDEDFRNDRVDAGEVGAGHEVTALFEVKLEKHPRGRRLAEVRLRYEDPESGRVTETSATIDRDDALRHIANGDPTFALDAAVAEFAEILRGSYWARGGSLAAAEKLAKDASYRMKDRTDVDELIDLIGRADRLLAKEPEWWKRDTDYRPAWEGKEDENE